MSNLVSLDQAAQLLGITPEKLNDMRLQNDIFGMRDGSNWNFRMDEVQRVADDLGVTLTGDAAAIPEQTSNFELAEGNDFEMGDDFESDFELSDSAELGISESEDLLLSSSEDVVSGDEDEDFDLADESDSGIDPGELSLAPDDLLAIDDNVLSDDEPPANASPSDTGKIIVDGDLELSEDDLFDDSGDEAGFLDSSEISNEFDSDIVLESSGDGSGPADMDQMTIQLDEGGDDDFSLDGAGIDDLELPEDSDLFSLDDSEISESVTILKSEDDFNLTPFEDASSDSASSSQVIALEDSAIYTDDSVPTEFDATGGAGALLDGDSAFSVDSAEADNDMEVAYQTSEEVPYTLLNVLALAATLGFVAVGGMLSYDLARNMWQPSGMTLDGGVANWFIELAGYTSN